MRMSRQLQKMLGGFRLLLQTQRRDEQRGDRCQVWWSLVLLEAAYMTFGVADGEGELTLGELGAPPEIFQQVPKGGKGGGSHRVYRFPLQQYTPPGNFN